MYKKIKICYTIKSDGFITLLSVLVVGAIGTTISVSLLLLGLGSSQTSFANEQSSQSRALANACIEEAVKVIQDNVPYTGTNGLTMGHGSCVYTVINDGGQNRTITSTGTVGNIIVKNKLIIDAINPKINIVSWQEVADF